MENKGPQRQLQARVEFCRWSVNRRIVYRDPPSSHFRLCCSPFAPCLYSLTLGVLVSDKPRVDFLGPVLLS